MRRLLEAYLEAQAAAAAVQPTHTEQHHSNSPSDPFSYPANASGATEAEEALALGPACPLLQHPRLRRGLRFVCRALLPAARGGGGAAAAAGSLSAFSALLATLRGSASVLSTLSLARNALPLGVALGAALGLNDTLQHLSLAGCVTDPGGEAMLELGRELQGTRAFAALLRVPSGIGSGGYGGGGGVMGGGILSLDLNDVGLTSRHAMGLAVSVSSLVGLKQLVLDNNVLDGEAMRVGHIWGEG